MKIIRVVDLETTGLAPPEAEVCEIGWVDLAPVAHDILGTPTEWEIAATRFGSMLVKPERPIPAITSAIHHLVDEDFVTAPSWCEALSEAIGATVNPIFRPTIYAAHNAKFERQFMTTDLVGPAPWICTYKCALRLWPDAPSHSNQALRYWRKPAGLIREIAFVAHRAMPDAYVTAFHLRDMLNAGATVQQLVDWSNEPALLVTCHVGKYRSQPWSEVDSGMMRWILDRDFDEDVKHTCRHWLKKRAQSDTAEHA